MAPVPVGGGHTRKEKVETQLMPWIQVFKYYAVKPLDAEHPIGSGTIVHYDVGEEFPGNDWGRSTDWLVENGRAVRMVDNVWSDEGDGASPEAAAEQEAESPGPSHLQEDPGDHFPVHEGAGWYSLSDGSRVRGKDNAEAAEAALGG